MPVCTFLALFHAVVSAELEAPRSRGAPRTACQSCLPISPTTHLPDATDARAQVLAMGQRIDHALEILLGLTLAIAGLALFAFGLLNGLMPMGERLGRQLPLALSLPALLGVAGALGVAVTLAEPALGVVKTAGSLIRKEQAPHLYVLLHEQTDLLLLAVALGVGLSASAGMLRIRWNENLKGPVCLPSCRASVFKLHCSRAPSCRHAQARMHACTLTCTRTHARAHALHPRALCQPPTRPPTN